MQQSPIGIIPSGIYEHSWNIHEMPSYTVSSRSHKDSPLNWPKALPKRLASFCVLLGKVRAVLPLGGSLEGFKSIFSRLAQKGSWGFPSGIVVNNQPANAGDMGSIPDLGNFTSRGATTEACSPRACAPVLHKRSHCNEKPVLLENPMHHN